MLFGNKARPHSILCHLTYKAEQARLIRYMANMETEYRFHIQVQQKVDTHSLDGQLIQEEVLRISQVNITLYMGTALFMPFGKVQAVQRSTILILIYRAVLEHSILCMEYTGKIIYSFILSNQKWIYISGMVYIFNR